MRPRVKWGLIIGIIGLVVNVFVSAAMGICGPFTSLVAGGLAGFLTARQEKPATQRDGALAGAIAGVIAGGFVFVAQIIGAYLATIFLRQLGGQYEYVYSEMPLIAYASSLAMGICIGLAGIVISTLVGAGLGFIGTPRSQQPAVIDIQAQ